MIVLIVFGSIVGSDCYAPPGSNIVRTYFTWCLNYGRKHHQYAIYFFEMSVLFETGELNAYVYDGGGFYRRKYV